jgi:hypothetical protein
MKQILFNDVAADIAEQYVREKFEHLDIIQDNQIIRDDDAQHPCVLQVIEIRRIGISHYGMACRFLAYRPHDSYQIAATLRSEFH